MAARSNKVPMSRPGLGEEAMKVRTGVRGGRIAFNRAESLKVKTGVKAGRISFNRCETAARGR